MNKQLIVPMKTGEECPFGYDIFECEKPAIVIDETMKYIGGLSIGVPTHVEDNWLVPEYAAAHCAKCHHTPQAQIKLDESGNPVEEVRIIFSPGI